MKIGIAGVGGIGSNVAFNLVRSGIDNIKFGDFDKIENSNLNRQFYFYEQVGEYKADCLNKNLKKIYGKKEDFEYLVIKFDRDNIREFFKDCDIIVDGFDKKEYKKILLEECFDGRKKIISVSGIGGIDTSEIVVKKANKNLYIVGDMKSDIRDYKTYSHKVVMVACKIAEIIVELEGVR